MFCEQCGNQLNGTERFCPACGTPVRQNASPTATPVPHRPVTKGSSYAMRSLNRPEPAKRVVRPPISAQRPTNTPPPTNAQRPTNTPPPASAQPTASAHPPVSVQYRLVSEAEEKARTLALYHSTHASYLPFAIIVTLFCCIPLGIIAIIMACIEANCLARGDIIGAERAHGSAQLWCWLAVGAGLLSMFFVLPNLLSMPWFLFLL